MIDSVGPNRWANRSVAIIACGPSLTKNDATEAFWRANRTIVVNEAWRLVPHADVLYAADRDWWKLRGPSREAFGGERWSQTRGWTVSESQEAAREGMNIVHSKSGAEISTDPTFIRTGFNSAFQALNLATLWGARRVVFLGLDMQHTGGEIHWHGAHGAGLRNPGGRVFEVFKAAFVAVAPQLDEMGVKVINASRATALECFERRGIEHAFD